MSSALFIQLAVMDTIVNKALYASVLPVRCVASISDPVEN